MVLFVMQEALLSLPPKTNRLQPEKLSCNLLRKGFSKPLSSNEANASAKHLSVQHKIRFFIFHFV